MGNRNTFTLKGEACRAFIEMQSGKKPLSENDELLRVATLVHMNVQTGNVETAIAILRGVVDKEKLSRWVLALALNTPAPNDAPKKPAPMRESKRVACSCCERGDEYNGFGSDGPRKFECPKGCACHD